MTEERDTSMTENLDETVKQLRKKIDYLRGFVADLLDLQGRLADTSRKDYIEIEKLRKERDDLRRDRVRWIKLCNLLVHGAESQIDDLRNGKTEANEAWLVAWRTYDDAINFEPEVYK